MTVPPLPLSPMTAERFSGRVTAAQCFWDGSTLSDLALVEEEGGWSIQQTLGISPGDMRSGSRFRTPFPDRESATTEFLAIMGMMDEHIAIEGLAIAYRGWERRTLWVSADGSGANTPHLFADHDAAAPALRLVEAKKARGEVVSIGAFSAIVCCRPVPEHGRIPSGWTPAPIGPVGGRPSADGHRMLGPVHIVGRFEPEPVPPIEVDTGINLVP